MTFASPLKLLTIVVLGTWMSALIAQDVQLPTASELQSRISAVQKSEDLTPTEKSQSIELLELIAERLRQTEALRERAAGYREALAKVGADRQRLAESLANIKASVVDPKLLAAPLEEIEVNLLEAKSAAELVRSRLAAVETEIQDERDAPLQALIDETQDAIDSIDISADTQPSAIASPPADKRLATLALKAMREAKLSSLEQRLVSRSGRLSVLELEAELLRKQLEFDQRYAQALEAIANQKRLAGAQSLAQQSGDLAQSLQSAPEPLKAFSQANVRLARELAELVEQRQRTETQLEQIENQSNELVSKIGAINRLLDGQFFDSTAAFGAALRRERDSSGQVPGIGAVRTSAEKALTESRIALFVIEERQAPYNLSDDALMSWQSAAGQGAWTTQIESLLDDRQRLVTELASNHRRHIDALSAMLSQSDSIVSRSTRYRELLESHLFWIPSADWFGFQSLAAAGTTLAWLQNPSHWDHVKTAVQENLTQNLPRYVLGLLLLFASVMSRRMLKRELLEMEPLVGKVRTDRFSLTAWAIGITFLLALPIPLLLFWLSSLTSSVSGFASGLSAALWAAAVTMLFMQTVLQLVRPKGLAEVHFRWQPGTIALVGRVNRWLIAVLVPTVIVMVLLDRQATPEIRDGLGRLTLVLLCLTIAVALYQLFKTSRKQLEPGVHGTDWYLINIVCPLLIIEMFVIILLSWFGYHYSATQLLARVVESLFLATFAILVYYVLARASSVYERRLALERLLAKRAAASAQVADRESAEQAGEGVPEVVDNLDIDRHTISQQTSTALRSTVWIGFIVAFAYVWRDLLPVARSLDDWVIWQVASDNPALQSQSITLWSVLVALSVIIISFIAVKNLPGVLEVLVLSRLDLTPGTGYAVTTVAKYLIVIVGAIVVTNLLGADWSKLQWLVAALGVGLGFGLQEIVANFVSGIIILFEKPFRLGDTVTIGGQSGTVTRIQIRATTISDWDRKEIIIPNKAFVTNDFVNWTLSDATTRLVIPVGVAYGSDNELVVSTLLSLARSNTKVLDDPAPAALFLGFGDSSLSFELRVFTRSVADRLNLVHDLHLAIDRRFRELGIEISFPQRDVHLSTNSPIEVIMKPPVDTDIKPAL